MSSRCFGDMSKCKRHFASEVVVESRVSEQDRQRYEGWGDTFKTPEQYVNRKLKMLNNEMYIYPTKDEIAHLRTLKTRIAIDNAVHSIIDRYWCEG